LSVDVIGSLLCEWLASYEELAKLDSALVNIFIREKYLEALKNTNAIFEKDAKLIINKRQFSNLICWKDKRGVVIPQLKLKYYKVSMEKYVTTAFCDLVSLSILWKVNP